jgi:hypothetical protein
LTHTPISIVFFYLELKQRSCVLFDFYILPLFYHCYLLNWLTILFIYIIDVEQIK